MNIVVAMKQIPDLQQIRISNRRPVLEDVPLTFGSIDKSALEAAVVIRESSEKERYWFCLQERRSWRIPSRRLWQLEEMKLV